MDFGIMSALFDLIKNYRTTAKTEREKGTYFELLCIKYFENEPLYADLFAAVQTYTKWVKEQGLSGKDIGKTSNTARIPSRKNAVKVYAVKEAIFSWEA